MVFYKKDFYRAVFVLCLLPLWVAKADYVIGVAHLKNGNQTVLTRIGHYNSMSDCKKAAEELLSRANRHTGGSWFIADHDNKDLVSKAYFFHDEPGLSCVVIPSNYGSE